MLLILNKLIDEWRDRTQDIEDRKDEIGQEG